jgi:hypothetical protein
MIERSNGQVLPPQDAQPRSNSQLLLPTKPKAGKYTGEILLRTRPKTYRKVVQLLSEDMPVIQIMRLCRVAQDTVIGVRNRESETISERKNKLATMLSDVATLGTERMTHTIGKACLRDAAIGTGVAVDKMLALTGATPVAVGVVVMPSEAERENMRTLDRRLDEIAKRLARYTPKVIELPPNE